jgi:hypothetical protein
MTALRMVHKVITRAEMRRIKTEYFLPYISASKRSFAEPGNCAAAAGGRQNAQHITPLDACPALIFFLGFP